MTRNVCDGLRTQRLDKPYIRRDGRLVPASWEEALALVAEKLKSTPPERVGAIAGDLAGAEEMFAMKDLMSGLGIKSIDCRAPGEVLHPSFGRPSYLFNSTIEGIDGADAILLVGTNPRLEAPVLNSRIRRRWRNGGVSIGLIGEQAPLTYAYEWIGDTPDKLSELASGSHMFSGILRQASAPMIIVGPAAYTHPDGQAVLAEAARIAAAAQEGLQTGRAVFNILHSAAARAAGLDLGLVPAEGGRDTAGVIAGAGAGEIDVVYLLGADEFDMGELGQAFVIYQGTHGDAGAHRADVILPGAAYTEKSATYLNTEGRTQMTQKAIFAPGEAKEDWTILRALSAEVGKTLPYDRLQQLRAAIYKAAPHFQRLDEIGPHGDDSLNQLAERQGSLSDAPFVNRIKDFYFTNPIARASGIMAELSALKAEKMSTGQLRAAE